MFLTLQFRNITVDLIMTHFCLYQIHTLINVVYNFDLIKQFEIFKTMFAATLKYDKLLVIQ